jgi:hypothetical protein
MRFHAALAPLGVAAGFVAFAARSAEVSFCLQLTLELTCLGDRSAVALSDRLEVRLEQQLQEAHGQGFPPFLCALTLYTVRAESGMARVA